MKPKRNCGTCRECCIVLEVEPIGSPRDIPCTKLCAGGCGIYAERPESCKTFTCAWIEGMMSRSLQPNRTHMVIWSSKLLGAGSQDLPCVQCNIGVGHKRNKKTMRHLMGFSFQYPVLVIQSGRCELFKNGRTIAEWNEGDFLRFDYDGDEITGAQVIPADEVLDTAEKRAAWRKTQIENLEVVETDPKYRAEQIKRVEELS